MKLLQLHEAAFEYSIVHNLWHECIVANIVICGVNELRKNKYWSFPELQLYKSFIMGLKGFVSRVKKWSDNPYLKILTSGITYCLILWGLHSRMSNIDNVLIKAPNYETNIFSKAQGDKPFQQNGLFCEGITDSNQIYCDDLPNKCWI